MKLKKLKDIIFTDLKIIDHSVGVIYECVNCYGQVFEMNEDKEVIGIRADDNCVIISVK